MRESYPKYFPYDCPPKDSEKKEILVYRLAKNDPLTSDDFLPYFILYPNNSYENTGYKEYGVSVYKNLEEINQNMALNPKLRKRFKYIAKGITCKDLGVVKETPSTPKSSHITWWLYENAEPHKSFLVV